MLIVPTLTSKDVIEFRSRLGLTQTEFALRYDIPLTTLRNWEQGLAKPLISRPRIELYNELLKENRC